MELRTCAVSHTIGSSRLSWRLPRTRTTSCYGLRPGTWWWSCWKSQSAIQDALINPTVVDPLTKCLTFIEVKLNGKLIISINANFSSINTNFCQTPEKKLKIDPILKICAKKWGLGPHLKNPHPIEKN